MLGLNWDLKDWISSTVCSAGFCFFKRQGLPFPTLTHPDLHINWRKHWEKWYFELVFQPFCGHIAMLDQHYLRCFYCGNKIWRFLKNKFLRNSPTIIKLAKNWTKIWGKFRIFSFLVDLSHKDDYSTDTWALSRESCWFNIKTDIGNKQQHCNYYRLYKKSFKSKKKKSRITLHLRWVCE